MLTVKLFTIGASIGFGVLTTISHKVMCLKQLCLDLVSSTVMKLRHISEVLYQLVIVANIGVLEI